MGYSTEFKGEIAIDPPLTLAEFNQINDMEYGNDLPLAPQGYCQWVPNKEGTAILWNDGEKFYYADEWMQYVINEVLAMGGKRIINGTIHAQGEEMDDKWVLVVENNTVSKREFVFTSKKITCPNCDTAFYIEQADE